MRILVTGGAGFIGSNICDAFIARGHDVAILDDLSSGRRENMHAKARFFEIDLSDGERVDACIAEFKPEVVDHHAAQIDVRDSVQNPVRDARINILGALQLLQSCTRHGVRKFIYASTGGAIYGEGRELPATEAHPINPEAPYGASKHAVEHYLHLWKLLHGLDYTTLRYPNVFGPRQNPHGEAGVNAIFIGLMLQGKRPRIFGDGKQVRDYLFVDDVVEANVMALESGGGETMNLGTGVGTSVIDIVDGLNRVLSTHIEPIFEPARAGEVQRIYLDAAHARQVMGWAPKTSFNEGLKRTVDWFRASDPTSATG